MLTGKRLTAQKKVRKCEPDGETTGIRTPDTRLRRPLLYPAELRAHKNGAEDEIRTRDPRLGKAMLYP